jgi:hypothetical protein
MAFVMSIWGTIEQIFNVIRNLPAIIALLEQIMDMIRAITGESGKDETAEVNELKGKVNELAGKAKIKRAKLVSLHDHR